ncbi:MAG TPA: hypothetical protein VJT72_07230, partial [Pseudonocardiaceae bacterium]|nr:hypothetical protein [Pseudonocardiaceae bacterium]
MACAGRFGDHHALLARLHTGHDILPGGRSHFRSGVRAEGTSSRAGFECGCPALLIADLLEAV